MIKSFLEPIFRPKGCKRLRLLQHLICLDIYFGSGSEAVGLKFEMLRIRIRLTLFQTETDKL